MGALEPMQTVRVESASQCTFIRYLPLSYNHWDKQISPSTINHARHLVAHWDGLDTGARLRRAARQYCQAIGETDDLLAFQYAYVGLEAMEKPLATTTKLEPGVEIVTGQCEHCKVTYKRRKTMLSGVRAYVRGDFHPDTASSERAAEWKEMNDLRQQLFHGLIDRKELEDRTQAILPAVMHNLHDAIYCQSHSHGLESSKFALVRRAHRFVLMGTFSAGLESLERWTPLLGMIEPRWVKDDRFEFLIPEFPLNNPGIPDLQVGFFLLQEPLSSASEAHLRSMNYETGPSQSPGSTTR